ncbi:hypothetical protein QYE76_069433 [Lolium multiflorum]|uniref:Uncharacterized protein n=1 Tax=Lolium multiflorum TaxID=4521 RepID=A0AAD8SHZ5_LOLMU|nr:hypothetical protein QYE76_069433 [Lolium multiflorum]
MSSSRDRPAALAVEAFGPQATLSARPTSLPPEPAAVLAAATLARRRSDPAVGGHMRRARRFRKPVLAYPPCEELRDPAVVVEGLGCLSLPPLEVFPQAPSPSLPVMNDDVSGVAQCSVGVCDGERALEKVAGSGVMRSEEMAPEKMDDDEELAPRTPSVSTNGVVPGSVCDAADVRHGGKTLEELCDGLSPAAAALGVEEGWVQVGRGNLPGHEPLSLLRKEGLERSLAFKRWARGRCFRRLQEPRCIQFCAGYAPSHGQSQCIRLSARNQQGPRRGQIGQLAADHLFSMEVGDIGTILVCQLSMQMMKNGEVLHVRKLMKSKDMKKPVDQEEN